MTINAPAESEVAVAGIGNRVAGALRPGSKPSLQARLAAAALADQVGRAYSAGQSTGSTR
jgi:hypothetical protein